MLYYGVMAAEHVLYCTPMIPLFHEPSVRARPFVSSPRIRTHVSGDPLARNPLVLYCEYRTCHPR